MPDDPVGLKEIAERLGVRTETAHQWVFRQLLPAPRWVVAGRPAWAWADVEAWAVATGRLPDQSQAGGLNDGSKS